MANLALALPDRLEASVAQLCFSCKPCAVSDPAKDTVRIDPTLFFGENGGKENAKPFQLAKPSEEVSSSSSPYSAEMAPRAPSLDETESRAPRYCETPPQNSEIVSRRLSFQQMSKPISMDSPRQDTLLPDASPSLPRRVTTEASHARKNDAAFCHTQAQGLEHLCKCLPALSSSKVGERIDFPGIVRIDGRQFTGATVEHDFRSAGAARLVCLIPGRAHFVFKLGDVLQEVAAMCALGSMNQRWQSRGINACNMPVEAVTYNIIPLGTEAGLIEAVANSRTLRELAHGYSSEERHLRVLHALQDMPSRLDRLAATTVAYLTAGYALGVRDSHDDNIMLRDDGSFFRVDFGFIFGAAPNLDASSMTIPRAVIVALGEERWREVVTVCEQALVALSEDLHHEPPAWACIRSVPEMALFHTDALAHVRTLSLEAFRAHVQRAHEWSLSRAAKNGIREVLRYIMAPEDSQETPKAQEQPPHLGCAPATWRFAQPGGDAGPVSEDEAESPVQDDTIVRL